MRIVRSDGSVETYVSLYWTLLIGGSFAMFLVGLCAILFTGPCYDAREAAETLQHELTRAKEDAKTREALAWSVGLTDGDMRCALDKFEQLAGRRNRNVHRVTQ